MIFVVDCADRDRIDEARQELHRIINDRLMKEAIILIFANKQDLPDGRYIWRYETQCFKKSTFVPFLVMHFAKLIKPALN